MNLDIEIGSNALKELSERMKWKVDAFSADEVFADSIANPSDEEERKAASFFNEYVIAQRIIAELAKPDRIDGRIAREIMAKCRAIADEGLRK